MPPPAGLPNSVSQTVKAGDVLALPISFQITGAYAQLQAFTQKVENLNRFTNITTLGVARNNSGPVSYTLSLNAYIKP
jgi:Tfp pilus assembly protein PilO